MIGSVPRFHCLGGGGRRKGVGGCAPHWAFHVLRGAEQGACLCLVPSCLVSPKISQRSQQGLAGAVRVLMEPPIRFGGGRRRSRQIIGRYRFCICFGRRAPGGPIGDTVCLFGRGTTTKTARALHRYRRSSGRQLRCGSLRNYFQRRPMTHIRSSQPSLCVGSKEGLFQGARPATMEFEGGRHEHSNGVHALPGFLLLDFASAFLLVVSPIVVPRMSVGLTVSGCHTFGQGVISTLCVFGVLHQLKV